MEARVEPELDESSARRLERDLTDRVAAAETVEPEVAGGGGLGGGFGDRTMPAGGGGGRRGPGLGAGLQTAGAGQAARSLGATAIGGAAVVLGTVFLGGVLANRMYDAMSQASGRLQAVNSMFGSAMKLFFKPFGDALGKTLLPFAKAALDMAVQFNKIASDEGLRVGIAWLDSEVEGALGGVFASALEGLGVDSGAADDIGGLIAGTLGEVNWLRIFGNVWGGFSNELARAFARELSESLPQLRWSDWVGFLVWSTFIPQFGWDQYIDDLSWQNFIDGVNLGSFVDGLGGGGGGGGGRDDPLTDPTAGFDDFTPDTDPDSFLGDPELAEDVASGDTLSSGSDFGVGAGRFAHGGVVNRPTRAVIGEAGPEAVVPLDDVGGDSQAVVRKLDEVLDELGRLASALGDVTIEHRTELHADRRTLAETVDRARAELLPSTDTRTQ